jgi:hypothetical protein
MCVQYNHSIRMLGWNCTLVQYIWISRNGQCEYVKDYKLAQRCRVRIWRIIVVRDVAFVTSVYSCIDHISCYQGRCSSRRYFCCSGSLPERAYSQVIEMKRIPTQGIPRFSFWGAWNTVPIPCSCSLVMFLCVLLNVWEILFNCVQ